MVNNTVLLIGVGVVIAGSSVFAIDRPLPSDGAGIPQNPFQRGSEVQLAPLPSGADARPMIKKKCFLGIQPTLVPPALAAQLKLDGGWGVLVDAVVPGSPAEKAGIRKFDVITKVGQKYISKLADIREGMGEAQAGDKVAIELFRGGERQSLELTLDQAMSAPAESMAMSDDDWQKHIERAIGAGNVPLSASEQMGKDLIEMHQMMSKLMALADGEEGLKAARQQIERARQLSGKFNQGKGAVIRITPSVDFHRSGSLVYRDNLGEIEIKTENAKSNLTVKDQQGQTIFSGPYTTDQEKASVPDHIKQRLQGVCGHSYRVD